MICHSILIKSKDRDEKIINNKSNPSSSKASGFDLVIEVDEEIDDSGIIIHPLAEHEINRILRIIFTRKNANIIIRLKNSNHNPVHEKTIFNLLQTAGYKMVTTSYQDKKNS